MSSDPAGTVTVVHTQTVTYTSHHHRNTPAEPHAEPRNPLPDRPGSQGPHSQEGYSNSMPPPPPPPPQPGFPFDPFVHPGQIPPPMVLPLGSAPSYQAGAVMDPLTAVLSIIVVAGMYWGFKNGTSGFNGLKSRGGASGAPATSDAETTAEDPKKSSKSSSSSKDTKGDEDAAPSMPVIPAVSPSAFISLIAFSLLAAVIIQGPLGLKAAFSGQEPNSRSSEASASPSGASLGLTGLLDILSARLPTFPSGAASSANTYTNNPITGVVPQMAGQGSSSDKNGHSQWNWYANPIAVPVNQQGSMNMGNIQSNGVPAHGKIPSEMDKLAFAGLPPLLQTFPICQKEPILCSSLEQHMDRNQLAALLGVDAPTVGRMLGQPTTVQPSPVPLVPKQGFLGSYQGLKDLETLFYPMLIGAIGLIILFDYGT